jgi:AraC-like DNA-binding protein
MDPLRRLFPLLNIDLRDPTRIDTGGNWALCFPGSSHVRFGAVVAGFCWLTADGAAKPLKLECGDGYLLTRGQSYAIASDPSLPAEDGVALLPGRQGGPIKYGPGEGTSLISGRFKFDELSNELLLQVLPPVVHLSGSGLDSIPLKAAIDIVDYETRTQGFGATLITHHVAQIMVVQSLRSAIVSSPRQPMGWLAGLADPRIGMAMELMHEQIDKRWTVAELAKAAGMSRSLFARRFKELSGSTPLDYLLRLRMRIALEALRSGQRNIATIGYEMGYQSESAFTVAFSRVMGRPPSEFRKSHEMSPSD